MDVLMSFGIAGVVLLLGMAIRGKSKFVQSMLIPAAVLGGVIGFICMNTFIPALTDKVSFEGYTAIVNTLFTVSFISIGLTRPARQKKTAPEPGEVKLDKKGRPKKKKGGPLYRGSMGMGLAWCILFSLQGGLGILLASVVGPLFGMDAVYGMLIPYGFCQGPGQAATNGTVYETVYGITNASQVAITFAVIGFLSAFVVGVPLAKLGIKLGLDYMQDSTLQSKITGFCSDFLVVMAFMPVQLGAVGSWIVPIVIIAVVITAVTAVVSLFFSQHFGDSNDFERFLGLYGTACGTTPSGLSLVRIVDPALSTTTGAELGMMNMPEMLCTFSFIVIMLIASGVVPPIIGAALLLVMIPIYMAIMKMTGCLNKRTWSLNAKWNAEHPSIAVSEETSTGRLQGSLAISPEQTEEAVQSAMA